ncbi:MAG: thiamine pyrophosphate-binding protein [Bacteroidetes bacterium]|nr:thiamine pyrophosphate-binding protein [Bacteroidota bacterium]
MMMHLLDAVSKSKSTKYICNHHEQASAIAAEAYARVKNDIGVCFATSGPGATNTITGIAGAWLDSSPVIYITGQSRTVLTVRGSKIDDLRMIGNFEVDITEIVKPITKYNAFVDKAEDILFHLEKAYYIAKTGRPGPVLLDIPLDIQGAMVNPDNLTHFTPEELVNPDFSEEFEQLKKIISKSKKILIIGGHGIRVSNLVNEFRALIHKINVPVVTTQLANDLLSYEDELYIGKVGLRGDRAGNFAVQSADLIISIGSSLHITTTGYDLEDFAPQAYKVVIDIDKAVLEKNKSISQLQINTDISTCFKYLNSIDNVPTNNSWTEKLTSWKNMFKIINEPHQKEGDSINTYHLINLLSETLKGDEIVISDAGSLYYIIGQAFKTKINQRVIISGALGAMGYALPASIGACFAEPNKNVICITGDGSMQLNVQELQTISTYNLNCKIIVINNKGYASIRNSQASFLDGHIAASSESTGVTFPKWETLASAYSIPFIKTDKYSSLEILLNKQLAIKGPVFIEIEIPETVIMIPAVTSERLPNGSFKSNKLHQMSPALDSAIMDKINLLD